MPGRMQARWVPLAACQPVLAIGAGRARAGELPVAPLMQNVTWAMDCACLCRAVVSLAMLVLLLGCGSGDKKATARVHGKVTYKGQPVPEASLVFVPVAKGPSAQANADRNGNYVLGTYKARDGAVVGDHRVMITAISGPVADLPENEGKVKPVPVSLIPSRYSNLEGSGLKAAVKSGVDNEINFELKD